MAEYTSMKKIDAMLDAVEPRMTRHGLPARGLFFPTERYLFDFEMEGAWQQFPSVPMRMRHKDIQNLVSRAGEKTLISASFPLSLLLLAHKGCQGRRNPSLRGFSAPKGNLDSPEHQHTLVQRKGAH